MSNNTRRFDLEMIALLHPDKMNEEMRQELAMLREESEHERKEYEAKERERVRRNRLIQLSQSEHTIGMILMQIHNRLAEIAEALYSDGRHEPRYALDGILEYR